jgi:hypothetical protein
MKRLNPDNLDYPLDDERFATPATEMGLASCNLWLQDPPPEPIFNTEMKEKYEGFIQRQAAYAAFRNEVAQRRDSLKLEEQRLLIPQAPFGEDIQAAINWVQNTGLTPLEFLTQTYRSSGVKIEARIAAATKVMDYVHRRLPRMVEAPKDGGKLTAQSLSLKGIHQLSDRELEVLEQILSKLSPEAK